MPKSDVGPKYCSHLSVFMLVSLLLITVYSEFVSTSDYSYAKACFLIMFLALTFLEITFAVKIYAITAACVSLVTLFYKPSALDEVIISIDRAAFLTFFLTSFGFLREAAKTSKNLKRLGRVLLNQRGRKSYFQVAVGSHILSILLSIGSLNIFGSMIKAGRKTAFGQEDKNARKKQLFLASLRGFSTVPLWAPTSISMLLIFSTFSSIKWNEYFPIGILASVFLISFSIIFEKFDSNKDSLNERCSLSDFAFIMPLVFGLSLMPVLATLITSLTNVSILFSILIVTPLFSVLWIYKQYFYGRRVNIKIACFELTRRKLVNVTRSQRSEIVFFSSCCVLGGVLSSVIKSGDVGDIISVYQISGSFVILSMSVSLIILSMVGINAIVPMIIFLEVLEEIGDIGVPPGITVLVIAGTWSIYTGLSPASSSVRLTALLAGLKPFEVGVVWNGIYSFSVLGLLYMLIFLFS